jgi:hypothetical protein
MAAETRILDLTKCIKIGKYVICPYSVGDTTINILWSEDQFNALESVPALTAADVNAANTALEANPIPGSNK